MLPMVGCVVTFAMLYSKQVVTRQTNEVNAVKVQITENIRALRKERGMTQERLAEALGVTTGAVHKWESGASMPEIRMLMEIADLFGVSVDALLGYEMRNSSIDDALERITGHLNAKNLDRAISEAEKALLRYPNSFRVVICCAEAYGRKGVEEHNDAASRRAIELMERSIPLLSQNDNPEISEQTIRSEIAVGYISMGDYEKAIEILKKYNTGGLNDAAIAMTMSVMENHDKKETEEYLTAAFSGVATDLIRTMSAYINYYIRTGNIKAALEASQWFMTTLDSVKIDADMVCYTDRLTAALEAMSSSFMMYLGQGEEAEKFMHSAYRRATAFDSLPVYTARGIKFLGGENMNRIISDDLGETAISAVERVLRSDERNRQALELWEQIKASQL